MAAPAAHGRWLLRGGICSAFCLFALSTALAADEPRHPLHRAVEECREARRELEKADSNFGGFKEAAIKSTDHAIRHLERMLGWVREHKKEELKQEFKDEKRAEVKGEKYPRLHAALHELRRAHKYVEEAKHDFGDSKQKEEALRSLHHAILDLEKALRAG